MSRFALALVALIAFAPPLTGQRANPRDFVVMLEWRNYLGTTQRGAGIIVGRDGSPLILTAGHNLRDEEGNPSQELTVQLHSEPGRRLPASIVYESGRYDLGLVQITSDDLPPTPTSGAGDILGTSTGGDLEVFIIGYGDGEAWSPLASPVPARFRSAAEIIIDSVEPPGQSGGAVFDQDWGLIGMTVETEGPQTRALPIGLVLDELGSRYGVSLTPSAEAQTAAARRELAERNISWSVDAVADALVSADFEVLDRFITAGAEPDLLLEALGRPSSDGSPAASRFFERTRTDSRLVPWIRAALDAGLDPDGAVPTANYERVGLLHTAIAAGNAPAAHALLEVGASPHAFQELWFTRHPVPRFLFPIPPVVEHATLTEEEKRALTREMLEAGAIIPDVRGLDNGYQTLAMQRLLEDRMATASGMEGPNEPTELGAGPVCRRASERFDFDWCGLARRLPRRIVTDPQKIVYGFWQLEIVGLLNVFEDRAYFLGLERDTYFSPFSLVEVSRDARRWRVYRHMSAQPGLGLCPEEDGFRPDDCWRRLELEYDPQAAHLMLDGYYEYRAFPDRLPPSGG